MSWLDPRWTYDQTVAEARRRIAADRDRGGPYAPFAELNEQILSEHTPRSGLKGTPCNECGEPWPCGMFRGIFAAD